MADPPDIPALLSDRTLAHGRNVMAAAGVILVLAWVPNIEIRNFEPLGFKIKEDGELSIWGLLAGVLVYYAVRFGYECFVDYIGWMETQQAEFHANPPDNPDRRHAVRLRGKFWGVDVLLPALMFLAALVATVQQFAPLVFR